MYNQVQGKSSSGHKQTPYERARERNMATNEKIWKALSESVSFTASHNIIVTATHCTYIIIMQEDNPDSAALI